MCLCLFLLVSFIIYAIYDDHCYITWCIDFHNYYIFIVDLPYLIQYGIFYVESF